MKRILMSLLATMMFGLLSVGFVSCKDDDDKEEAIIPVTPVQTNLKVKNGSSYSLNRFTVVFVNSRMEWIDEHDFGTLDPNKTVTYEIPTGATEYFMAFYSGGTWWLSANYDVSNKNISLTNSIIGTWTSSSSANSYPKASSAN